MSWKKKKNQSDTLSVSAFDPFAGHSNLFCVGLFFRLTSIKGFRHLRYCNVKVCIPAEAEIKHERYSGRLEFKKRGRAGIEPATSRTQSENHTTRPTAHSIAAKHARRDSNPQPPDSKSDALSVAPRALVAIR